MNKIYKILKLTLLLFLCVVILIPFIIFILYLWRNNKTLKIHPKFEIIEAENNFVYNEQETRDSVRIGREILEKLKEKT